MDFAGPEEVEACLKAHGITLRLLPMLTAAAASNSSLQGGRGFQYEYDVIPITPQFPFCFPLSLFTPYNPYSFD